MTMPNMSHQQSSNLPPRFPPPPPFIPAVFPPGFMQGMPVPGNMSSMPSWPGQPFMNQNLNSGIQHNATAHQENLMTVPPTSAARTSTVPETVGASNDNSTQEINSQTSEISASASDSQNLNSENSSQTSTENTSSVSEVNPSRRDSDIRTDPQNSSDTRTVPQNELNTGSNVRQRLVEPTRRVAAPGHVGQNAELPREHQSGGSVSLIIIAMLGLAILALIIRRLYLSRYWRYISF